MEEHLQQAPQLERSVVSLFLHCFTPPPPLGWRKATTLLLNLDDLCKPLDGRNGRLDGLNSLCGAMASPTHIIAPSCSCTRFAGTQELRNAYGLRCACAAPALLRTHQGSPLHAAAAAAVERLPVVVAHGDAPLPVDACGSTPLHSAAAQGDPEAVHLLLRSCGERAAAECSALNWCGMTPIHSLAANPGPGSCAALSVMMHFGASLHDRTKPFGDNDDDDMGSFSGETALSLAAQHSGDHQAGLLVALLLQAGLDPLDPAGPMHTTPLEFASAAGGEPGTAGSTGCEANRNTVAGSTCKLPWLASRARWPPHASATHADLLCRQWHVSRCLQTWRSSN